MPMKWSSSNDSLTNIKPTFLHGHLVGNKKPLSELVTEYAQADETYVVKTTALAVTHSTYRPIKGDGQCGWRGAVFGYFEILLGSGDLGLITQEHVRLQSFEQTMRAVGIDYDIVIDMFDYTWELFDAIKSAIEHGNKNEAVLLECMNDQGRSDSIVYHFKMMTSAFMRIQSDRYEAFLEMPVASYCESRIDPANQEIDHIGLQALTDAVIAPAYIGLEVSYLDRSIGDEVTPHPFVLDSQGWPTIRLIYRPGHYDIIYKDDGPIQVLLQTETPQYVMPFHNDVFRGDEDALNMHSFMFPNANIVPSQTLPGSAPSPMHSYPQAFQNPQPAIFDAQATTMQNSYFPPVAHMTSQQLPQPQHQTPPLPVRSLSMPHLSHSCSLAPSLPATSPSTLSPSTPTVLTPVSGGHNMHKPHEYQIRYNTNCYQYNAQRQQSLPLDPGSFGSSASSPAHFANADFQPELWNAEEEYGKRD
ncbi:ubiquitin thioesterase OTUB1, variant 1 [Exophiala viscosa]|uniref:ubiquitin thioesterase OTUB1, variant 1 n=1 Tax=Exophiala viscosa TaxID=2486360 RepID=UPI00219AC9A2|nr:ubiquitin thioesterase OTUB1, variant 1 [Exophiala viscosa]